MQAGNKVKEEEVKEWIKNIKWETLEIISENNLEHNTGVKKGKDKTRGKKKGKTDKQNTSQLILPVQPFLLSEFEKYELVKKLYDCLPEDGKYLKDFYDTLRILDAGYMANEKHEAHRIFREIYNITVIPLGDEEKQKEDTKEKLKNHILEFFDKYDDQPRLYTKFKKEILSKYIVSIPFNAKKFSELYPDYVEFWIKEQPKFEKYKKQLLRWFKNIFFVNYEYSETLGINTKTEDKSGDRAFQA
jgi:CRISPR-associated endonuclease/helicase Cas3